MDMATTGLDLTPSPRAQEMRANLVDFMNDRVFPAEKAYHAYRAERSPDDHTIPPVVEELKLEARRRGLWNLFLPAQSGISQLDYAGLAEITGWSLELAPEATNGQAPDTGNMELLHLFGTPEQKARWLDPSPRWISPLGLRHDRNRRPEQRREQYPDPD
jgi:acyl-CoA dehydrogenase